MKTVLMFPGTDAVEREDLRVTAYQLDLVKSYIGTAQDILLRNFGVRLDLHSYMESPNERSFEGFQKLVVCSLATQVALYEKYVESYGMPNYVMGLSLGDVARSVCSGLCSFEAGVKQLFRFTSIAASTPRGLSIHLRLSEAFASARVKLKFDEYEIKESVIQTETSGLVAGLQDNVERWISEVAVPNGIVCRVMYPFALHNPIMQPSADALLPFINEVVSNQTTKVETVSCVFARVISTQEEFISDCANNIAATLDFPKTISAVLSLDDEVSIVDLGPSDSLTKFIKYMSFDQNVDVFQYFKEVQNEVLVSV